jgi:hypothetical protein
VANPKDRTHRGSDPEHRDAPRDAGTEQRIDQRREQDKEISRREEEGYSQPESSAQKKPNPGPRP